MKRVCAILLLATACASSYGMRRSIPLRCVGMGPSQCSIEIEMCKKIKMWRTVLAAADHSPARLNQVLHENEVDINKDGQGARFLLEAVRDGN